MRTIWASPEGKVERGVVVEGVRGGIGACVRLGNKSDGVVGGGVLGNGADGGEAQRGELDHDVGELGKIVISLSGRDANRVAVSGRGFKGSGAIDVVHEDIRKIDAVFVREAVVMDGGMGNGCMEGY